MTFLELAEKILHEQQKPLNAEEIWILAEEKGYDKIVATKGKTPWATVAAQVYVNIRDKNDSPFAVTENRPKKFYLKSWNALTIFKDIEKIEEKAIGTPKRLKEPAKKFDFLEKDLHPFLSYFAFFHLNCFTKTLNHSKSGKGEFGEWVHPDLVGCSFQFNEWKKEVTEFSRAIGNINVKIFSFELKRELSFSNLREAFFQSVSNSSWANEGYLAAADISNDEDFRNELRRLSSSFGIGIIKLDTQDPDATEIIYPARYTEQLDWDTINKLTMNADFKDFISRVNKDIRNNEIYKEQYDIIFEREKLISIINKPPQYKI